MDESVRPLLEAARLAPSGENAQPWRFRARNKVIEVLDHSASDASLYNFASRGSAVAQGAAVENIVIAARSRGLAPSVRIPPAGDIVAEISLTKGHSGDTELAGVLGLRTTNRNPYRRDPLSDGASQALERVAEEYRSLGVSLTRVRVKKAVEDLARVAATNERIMLGNKLLHSFFFSHLTWTSEEDQRVHSGFYIKTLELPAPVQGLFRLIRYWPVMSALKLFGFPSLVGKGNAVTYASSAEYGIISASDLSRQSYLSAGRLLERIWLTLTVHGVALQPTAGTLFLAAAAVAEPQHFSPREQALLKECADVVRAIDGGGYPVFMYRAGYAMRAPSARATKFPIEQLLV